MSAPSGTVRIYRLLDRELGALLAPSRVATLATALLFTRADTLAPYAAYCLVAWPLLLLSSELIARRQLSTLLELGEGERDATPASIAAAAAEVARYPARVARVSALHAVLFCAGFAAVLALRGAAPSETLRVATLGLLLAPLCGALAHAEALVPRKRILEALMSAGLTAADLAGAAPRRHALRAHLIAFIAVAVFTSLAMTADLAAHLAQQGLRALAAAAPVAPSGAEVGEIARRLILELGALCLGLLFFLVRAARRIAAGIGGALGEIAEEAHALSVGRLSARPPVAGEGDIALVGGALHEIKARFGGVVAQFHEAGAQISAAAAQLSEVTRRQDEAAQRQGASLAETNATTEELARTARQIAESAFEVASMAAQTLEQAEGAQAGASECARAVAQMQVDNRRVVEAARDLDLRVLQIGKVVKAIHGIVDRSDLLALSAELEGTQAGAAGTGFTQVAVEMRRLADNVLQSTREIEQLVEEIAEATTGAVAATRSGLEATLRAGGMVSAVSRELEEIVKLAGLTADAIRAISVATHHQQSGADRLAAAMAQVLEGSRESGEANRGVGAAHRELTVLASELGEVVSKVAVEQRARHG